MKRPTEAFVSESLFEQGLGNVIVARFKAEGTLVECGIFLIDVYCLGAKNGFFVTVTLADYASEILGKTASEGALKPISPSCARKLIEGAVAYAQNLGFAPHPDYKKACRVLGGIESADCTEAFTYGDEGKPLYIQGPNESPDTARRIVEQLTRSCGQGNFHFLMPMGEMEDTD